MSSHKTQPLSTFVARLRDVRKAAFPGHGGQTSFATAIGIALTSYRRYEAAQVTPGPDMIEKMASAADVNANWLRWGIGRRDAGGKSGGIKSADELIGELWGRLDAAEKKINAYHHGEPAGIPIGESDESDAYKAGKEGETWELAAISRRGKRMRIRRVSDAPGPLGLYDGDETDARIARKKATGD